MWSSRNLFITEKQLAEAKDRLLQHQTQASLLSMDEKLRYQSMIDSTLHPDTGEAIFLPFRMSSFTPTNLVVTAGLLIPNPSVTFYA